MFKILILTVAVSFFACSRKEPIGFACMTFDDVISDSILDKFKGVRVTFFPVSKNIDKSLLNRAIQEGHQIGNHTSNSPNLSKLTLEEQRKEILLADDELGIVTKYLRPPYGEKNQNTFKLGKTVVIWDANVDDKPPTKGVLLLHREDRIETVLEQAKKQGIEFRLLRECLEAKQ